MTGKWVVDRAVEATALAESAKYTADVDMNRVLGPEFDAAIAAVLHVNTTYPDATGVDRLELLRTARQQREAR